jgi:hypothetical protein
MARKKFKKGDPVYLTDGTGPFEVSKVIACKPKKGSYCTQLFELKGQKERYKASDLRARRPLPAMEDLPAPEIEKIETDVPKYDTDVPDIETMDAEMIFSKLRRNSPVSKIVQAGKELNKLRPEAERKADNLRDNKRRLYPTLPNLKRWFKNPGRYDLIGVDNNEEFNPTMYKKELDRAKVMNLFTL